MSSSAAPSADERQILRSFARRIDPSDAGAYNNLGVLYYRKGLTEEAIAAFSRALALDERMRVASRNLEIAYGDSGTLKRRIEELGARLARNPRDIEALVQSAIAEKTSGDLQGAQSLFERAKRIDPTSSALHFFLAEVLYNRGLSEEALRSVRRSVALHPDNPDAHYLLGFILGDLGKTDEAAEANRRALALNPTLTRAQANLSLETFHETAATPVPASAGAAATQLELGFANRQKGFFGEALRAYHRALEIPGGEAAALQGMLELHLLTRDANAAIEAGARLTREFPPTTEILNEHGVALQMGGRHHEAEQRYRAALDLDSRYAFAQNNLGVVLWHNEDPRGATNSFRRALKADDPPIEPRLNLALALFRQKHLDLALEAYRQVVRIKPEHPVGWNGIGLILVDLERFEEARNAFARAIQAQPSFAEAHYNMSFTLSRLGDFNGALRETKQALGLDPLYSAQRLALALEFAHEESAIFVGPALADSAAGGQQIQDFHFDPAILEEIFAAEPASASPAGQSGAPSSFALARDYLSKGLHDRARAEVARVLARGGRRLEGLLLAGESFRAQGIQGEALERFNEALDLEPGNREALRGAALSLLALERAVDALPLAERLAESDAASPQDHLILAEARIGTGAVAAGRGALAGIAESGAIGAADLGHAAALHTSLGEHARAAELLGKSVELEPKNVQNRIALARALIASGDDVAADAELRSALDLDASNQPAQIELASLHRRRDEPRAALNLLVRLLWKDVYHFDALLMLGETLRDVGRDLDARRAFDRILRFHPGHEAARDYLEQLSAGVA